MTKWHSRYKNIKKTAFFFYLAGIKAREGVEGVGKSHLSLNLLYSIQIFILIGRNQFQSLVVLWPFWKWIHWNVTVATLRNVTACKHQYNVSIREDGMHHLLGIECTIGDKLLQTQVLTLCSKWCCSVYCGYFSGPMCRHVGRHRIDVKTS